MNPFYKFLAYLISLPAKFKGMKFGKNSFIGPGYDWLFVPLDGVAIGNDVMIGKNSWFQTIPGGKINVGDGCHIGRNFVISAIKKIVIGQECLISYNVSIFDHDHEFRNINISPMRSGLTKPKPTIVEDHCFIGAHSFILAGVHLGKHCVVGANSIVTKSFPDYSFIAGNPAVLIRNLKKKS